MAFTLLPPRGGASELNFKVVGGLTRPVEPAENTLWVKTDTPISRWAFSPLGDALTAIDGRVFIATQYANSVLWFDGIKGDNNIFLYPTVVQQAVSGAWVNKEWEFYKGDKWVGGFNAKITVNYPAGSTCKCTNGTTTLTASNTTGSFTFTVPDTGTWTVTATNGTKSDSRTVNITADGQTASVTLTFDLKIYANGTENIALTKSNVTNGAGGLTFKLDKGWMQASAKTSSTLDLSKYKTLTVNANLNCDGSGENGAKCNAVANILNASGSVIAKSAEFYLLNGTAGKILTVDTSGITGQCSVEIKMTNGSASYGGTGTVTLIELTQ